MDRWYARAVSSDSLPATLVRRYDRVGGTHAHEHAQELFGLGGTLQVEVAGHAVWGTRPGVLCWSLRGCWVLCAASYPRFAVAPASGREMTPGR